MGPGARALAERSAVRCNASPSGLQKRADLAVEREIGQLCRTSWRFVDFAFLERLGSGHDGTAVSPASSSTLRRWRDLWRPILWAPARAN